MHSAIFLLMFLSFSPEIKTESSSNHVIDDSVGLGRTFDGIGAISGGGATSKLLVNYPEKLRSQILDYLFKPNFGASLHILKCEIGGDAQSTDGSESSHMHSPWEENYHRGYEWWLMKEAKKRNPNIKLYGLPWGFPSWVGQYSRSPYNSVMTTASYVLKWVINAQKVHNLTIDYLGVWNEKPYNVTYIKTLRKLLDDNSQKQVKLVVADSDWSVSEDVMKDKEFGDVVDFIGVHYPGMTSTTDAKKTGKQLWSSEDYSTFNDDVGAGCMARITNRNYVVGMMTSTIVWNLIASYYQSLPFPRNGLMTADQPWSGYYRVDNPVWITAHTTQFTQIGWTYLKHGSGVGSFEGTGGSYVTLQSPDKKNVTIVIEKLSHDHSICVRPPLEPYKTEAENVTFTLKGSLANIKQLNVWVTKLNFGGQPSKVFMKMAPLQIVNGEFTLYLDVDTVFTLTTLSVGQKGQYAAPPPPQGFPQQYKDNFDTYPLDVEAFNFAQQTGAFEITKAENVSRGNVLTQVVLDMPLNWCGPTLFDLLQKPVTMIGNVSWSDVIVSVDVQISKVNGSKGVFVAARMDKGGCSVWEAYGLYFWMYPELKEYRLTHDLVGTKLLGAGKLPTAAVGQWHNLMLIVKGTQATGVFDGTQVFSVTIPATPKNGFIALGTDNFGLANFDNFRLEVAHSVEDFSFVNYQDFHVHDVL
ncbi:galactocerebrosidase-like [Lineus longissimus]|uniref:galactocerebrosidase-like n=1 Tax=Lineus longissimus TaxID=88925 RepID=UPI002B4EB4A5